MGPQIKLISKPCLPTSALKPWTDFVVWPGKSEKQKMAEKDFEELLGYVISVYLDVPLRSIHKIE